MSVNSWERKKSTILFIWSTHQLNQSVSEFVANVPKTYRNTYSDKLINIGLEAYQKLEMGNRIILNEYSSNDDFKERKQYFREAVGLLDTWQAVFDIFLNHLERSNALEEKKIEYYRKNLSEKVESAISLISAVIKKEKERVDEIKSNRSKK